MPASAISPNSAIWLLTVICETLISRDPRDAGIPIARTLLHTFPLTVKSLSLILRMDLPRMK